MFVRENFPINVLIGIFVVLAILQLLGGFISVDRVLDNWASSNNLRILSKERAWFFEGPFTKARCQVVYRITVADAKGQVRTGYARCGDPFFGMLSQTVDVHWDKPKRVLPVPGQDRPGFPVIVPDEKNAD